MWAGEIHFAPPKKTCAKPWGMKAGHRNGRSHTVDGSEIHLAPRNETTVESITFVGVYREDHPSSVGGTGFRTSTVWEVWLNKLRGGEDQEVHSPVSPT